MDEMWAGRRPWRTMVMCLLALALALLAGCTGTDEPTTPDVSAQLARLDPMADVDLAAGSTGERDPDAVAAALWRLDPCALITPPGGARLIDHSTSAPHACSFYTGRGYQSEVMVELGVRLGPEDRFAMQPVELSGVTAYVHPHRRQYGACAIWLPVSSEHAIRYQYDRVGCAPLHPLIRRTVERLGKAPDELRVPGLGGTDTCSLLRSAVGDPTRGRTIEYGLEYAYGIDSCTVVDPQVPGGIRALTPYASLEIDVQGMDPDWRKVGTIDGRDVYGHSDCTRSWLEGAVAMEVEARSCSTAHRFAAGVIAALDRPARPAEPQRPLLFRPDDPDTATGACADYMPLDVGRDYTNPSEGVASGPACRAYREPEVPDGAAETVVAADADPNVTCAVAEDAVRAYDPDLRPATLAAALPDIYRQPPFGTRPCVFTDPTHREQVMVFVSADAPPDDRQIFAVYDDSGPHPILWTHHGQLGGGRLIGLGDDLDDRGFVAVFVGKRSLTFGSLTLDGQEQRMRDAGTIADAIADEWLSY
ncbi:MAG: hypothetical protein ACRDO7_16135 [Nocardioidaceae bacterium]